MDRPQRNGALDTQRLLTVLINILKWPKVLLIATKLESSLPKCFTICSCTKDFKTVLIINLRAAGLYIQ